MDRRSWLKEIVGIAIFDILFLIDSTISIRTGSASGLDYVTLVMAIITLLLLAGVCYVIFRRS